MKPETLCGWDAITQRLGVASSNTAIAYARLPEDPLPVRLVMGEARARARYVDEWWARRNGGVMRDGTALERVWTIRHVAQTLGVDERTVLRLAKRLFDPLPLLRTGRRRWAYRSALRDFLSRQDLPAQAAWGSTAA